MPLPTPPPRYCDPASLVFLYHLPFPFCFYFSIKVASVQNWNSSLPRPKTTCAFLNIRFGPRFKGPEKFVFYASSYNVSHPSSSSSSSSLSSSSSSSSSSLPSPSSTSSLPPHQPNRMSSHGEYSIFSDILSNPPVVPQNISWLYHNNSRLALLVGEVSSFFFTHF